MASGGVSAGGGGGGAGGTVLLELGSVWVRVGFAGEAAPRAVLPAPVPAGALQKARQEEGQEDEEDRLARWVCGVLFRTLRCKPREVRVAVLEHVLQPRHTRQGIWQALCRLLKVGSSRTTTGGGVGVGLGLGGAEAGATGGGGLSMLPALAMPLYVSMCHSGLVLDIGEMETRAMVFAGGRALLDTYTVFALGMHHVVRCLKHIVGEVIRTQQGSGERDDESEDSLDDEDDGEEEDENDNGENKEGGGDEDGGSTSHSVWFHNPEWTDFSALDMQHKLREEFMRAILRVHKTPQQHAQQPKEQRVMLTYSVLHQPDGEEQYTLQECQEGGSTTACARRRSGIQETVRLPTRVRYTPSEVLLQGCDPEFPGLPALLLRCLKRTPIDVRADALSNVVVMGGGAVLPGLHDRIEAELHALSATSMRSTGLWPEEANEGLPPASNPLADARVARLPVPAPDLAWVGASLALHAEQGSDWFVDTRQMQSTTEPPDWLSLSDEQWKFFRPCA